MALCLYTALSITQNVCVDDCKSQHPFHEGSLLTYLDLLIVSWVGCPIIWHDAANHFLRHKIFALVYSILNVASKRPLHPHPYTPLTKFSRHEVWTGTTPLGRYILHIEPRFHESKLPNPRTQRRRLLTFQVGAISGSFFGLSIMLTKLSILALFIRFVHSGGKLKTTMHIMMVVIVLYTSIASFDWVYSCRPLQKYWDLSITSGSCIYWLQISIFSCVMNTATDIGILILPPLMLRNLHVPRKQKIGVIIVLMTGGLYVEYPARSVYIDS